TLFRSGISSQIVVRAQESVIEVSHPRITVGGKGGAVSHGEIAAKNVRLVCGGADLNAAIGHCVQQSKQDGRFGGGVLVEAVCRAVPFCPRSDEASLQSGNQVRILPQNRLELLDVREDLIFSGILPARFIVLKTKNGLQSGRAQSGEG